MTQDKKMSEEEIIRAIVNEDFFGMIECDISAPESLKEKFSEMSPIFKNTTVGREHMRPHMKEYAEEHGMYKKPQRMLIGSLRAEKILLLTPLVKWYLAHGLKITKIYQVVQFIPVKCFEHFGHTITKARREGDLDHLKTLVAEIMKLVGKHPNTPHAYTSLILHLAKGTPILPMLLLLGNSVYGRFIMNKIAHTSILYTADLRKIANFIRSRKFKSLEEFDDNFFELEIKKKR